MPTETNTEPVAASHRGEVGGATPSLEVSPSDDSIDLLDLALVLAARMRFILLCGFVAALVTALVVLFMPQTFTATAAMLPPQKQSSGSALLGQLGGLASLVGGGGAESTLGLKNPDDLYIGLLESETIANRLIDDFHLMQVYRQKRLSDTRKSLGSHTVIKSEKSSLIDISVSDRDPKRAAAIANSYIQQLHQLMSHLAVTEASQKRLFFSQQLDLEKAQLANAEAALVATEQRTGIIQPQGQAEAVIATIMQLQAQISARQVELGALRNSATNENPEVVTLKSQIEGLRAQLADFEKGHPGSAAVAGNVLTPTSKVPAASLEYVRRLRDVKLHETLFELMARQYEMARIDEAKQSQAIQVVDPALVPDRRSWPPRTLLTLLAFVAAAALAAFWVILQAAWRNKMEDPETAAKIGALRKMI